MLVNADFTQPVIVKPGEYQWRASPSAGVERVMLDRSGAEVARATSIVRYAPGSTFPAHRHPGGEEILVLSGTFSADDEHFPAGWYLRNPPGSTHRPASAAGTTIFVKLMQMAATETQPVRIDTNDPENWFPIPDGQTCPLFTDGAEDVRLVRLVPGVRVFAGPIHGAEILLLAGTLTAADQEYSPGTWIRLPSGEYAALVAGEHGVECYVKTGTPQAMNWSE
ncbi:cupin domain-containing protein [[Empedobacter] haloabium]|uniref:Cupin domain-containing protein n=1 Tax=[Empedobacter] haloabium TaxID=592317 RepID=A0ABZ1UTG5_9BURK